METREYKGQNGSLTLTDTGVEIRHAGVSGFFLSGGLRGDKTIPYSRIVAVRMKKAGFVVGYLQLTLMGGTEAKAGWANAMGDENTVSFQAVKDNNEKFAEAKRLIEERIGHDGGHRSSGVDDLEKLANLKEKGVITEDEFFQKKKQLLGL